MYLKCNGLVNKENVLDLACLQQGKAQGSTVESVLIPVMREGGWKPRMTLCVSSQALLSLSSLPICLSVFWAGESSMIVGKCRTQLKLTQRCDQFDIHSSIFGTRVPL